jgi:PPE-repeat protein
MTFDPVQYKSTTRQQWEDAAEAWHRWGPTLETWLGPATEKMLDAATEPIAAWLTGDSTRMTMGHARGRRSKAGPPHP